MTKNKRKNPKSMQKQLILAGSLAVILLVLGFIIYKAAKKSELQTSETVASQISEPGEKQTIEFTRQIFSNTYKNAAKDNGDGFVVITEMKLRFPKSDTHSLHYWIAAKIEGIPVGASVADISIVNSLLDEKNAKSLQDIRDCYEGLSIFATDKPTGYQALYQKKLQDGRTYEVRQSKKECDIYIGDFTDFLSRAESI